MKTYQGLDDTYVAVKHGTPLPKDIDEFIKRVEADKAESEARNDKRRSNRTINRFSKNIC